MKKRKFIIITVLSLLGAGLAVFLLTRDSGPPVVVKGNFSAKDVAEIKSAVKRELWHEAFPNFSKQSIMMFPRMAKRAFTTRVSEVGTMGWPKDAAKNDAYALLSANALGTAYFMTNGPLGWRTIGGEVFLLHPHGRH